MKWFKHMTASFDDERIAALVGKGGESGLALYGAFWRVAEVVAAQMGKDGTACSASYPVWRWAQFLFVRQFYARSVLVRLQVTGLLQLEGDLSSDQSVTIKMPNLLKYRDEYSKKSGHTPASVGARTDGEGDTDRDIEDPSRTNSINNTKSMGKKATSPEVSKADSEPAVLEPPIGSIPTNKNGESYKFTQSQVDSWARTYPAVDVIQELREMRQWSIDNQRNRKTLGGMPKFINAWLGREQDRAKPGGHNGNGHHPQPTKHTAAAIAALQHNLHISDDAPREDRGGHKQISGRAPVRN